MSEQRNTSQEAKPNRHPPADNRDDYELEDDIERNPGIGQSKGTTMAGADADDLEEEMAEAENTFKGDVENDAGRPGVGVDPKRTGRHNK
jgi:hypothetical protein